ncbi:MAG: family 10 glycosylhydrolase [Mastigocoleus sp. MO_167.B18]|nr:family 10 glycosylhydrolase [Mastigocoleus sp. MO_167.B18]
MSNQNKKSNGFGCANIPISLILIILGGGWWWFSQKSNQEAFAKLLPKNQIVAIPILDSNSKSSKSNSNRPLIKAPVVPKVSNSPSYPRKTLPLIKAPIVPKLSNSSRPNSSQANSSQSNSSKSNYSQQNNPNLTSRTNQKITNIAKNIPEPTLLTQTPWERKTIRGIYLSRYHITNNTNELTIRKRVRYYRSQGFNTIIHGVWGNGCTMYKSKVMQEKVGLKSCPNKFQDKWLDWLIDEAHKQGMQVHAYFEKGIKIDRNSPIFHLALTSNWVVPGVDKTYPNVDHYVLNVEIPEIANFFKEISVEFVKKYPQIDAVQWDDYLGYHAELPGQIDRTTKLTNFVREIIAATKQANPKVSFDICHHNPYWAKRYFAADWSKWNIDRAFIQVYNDANFQKELKYVRNSAGIAISDRQFNRLPELVNNPAVKSILVFPVASRPEEAASKLKSLTQAKN